MSPRDEELVIRGPQDGLEEQSPEPLLYDDAVLTVKKDFHPTHPLRLPLPAPGTTE